MKRGERDTVKRECGWSLPSKAERKKGELCSIDRRAS